MKRKKVVLNKETLEDFIEAHAGEIKGLVIDKYWRDGGWNGTMGALAEVMEKNGVDDYDVPDGVLETLIDEYM